MKKMFYVFVFVFAMVCGTTAWAETPVMEVSDKSQTASEYVAVCNVIGAEPELCGVTIEEYLNCAEAWNGHMIIKAERSYSGNWVEKDSWWTSPITKTTEYEIADGHETIVCTDTHGEQFTVHLAS